jgi:CubicO group peptidase (beta-lactamase class C family)
MQNQLQDAIQNLLNTFVAEGNEWGVQVAAYVDGKLVVDAWAGVADVRTGRPVDGDTLFPVFSTTKGIFSTVIHILAERGQIDYDAPIAKYWPEFAANGKEAITMRHVLSHTAGIPYMPDGLAYEQLYDWDFMCAAIAQLKPSWPAGAKQVYHPITFGWVVGEVARRVDGRMVQQILEEEICRPLGLRRLFCGIPAELEPSTAFIAMVPDPPVTIPPPPNDVAPSMMPLHHWMNKPEARRMPQPGGSGIMNARCIARHYAALLPGGVDGVELLPPSRIRLATEEQVPSGGYDAGSGRKSLGYILGHNLTDTDPNVNGFGHGGYGGAQGFAHPHYRLALGLTRNRFSDHLILPAIFGEFHKALSDSGYVG